VTRGSGGGNFILEKIFTSPDLKLPLYYCCAIPFLCDCTILHTVVLFHFVCDCTILRTVVLYHFRILLYDEDCPRFSTNYNESQIQ